MAATNKRGVFSLEKVLERQVDNNWTDILDPFIYVTSVHPATTAGPTTGYFAGGYSPVGQDSRVDRIDYTNDSATASPKGNLSDSQSWIYGGASSTSHGYAFGGWTSTQSYSTIVSRVDYGNDTATASPKGPLSVGRRQHSAVGNANYGYAGGGYNGPSWNQMSIIDRVDYSSDTGTMTAVNPAGMTPGAYMTISTGNQSYGYFAGGYEYWTIGGYTSFVRRLDYASDTSATTPKGPMTTQGGDGAGTGNANYGYYKSTGNTGSAIERLDYANDTATLSSRGGVLTYTAYQRGATGSADYGYFGGGSSPPFSYVDRIDYTNDTAAASPKGKLNVGRYQMATFSSREYGMPQTSSEKSITPATRYEPPLPSPISAGPAYGYSGGGGAGTFGTRETGGSKVQRIDFASDTSTTSVRGNLAHEHLHGGAVGNATHGYVMGDLFTTTPRSWVSRVTYASDSSTASPRGSLTVARGGGSSTGNASYAWFSGAWDWIYGTAGPNASVVDRIDFANDNVTASARGNLDRAVGKVAASGNASYGWWYGGSGVNSFGSSSVSRVDYGNDTATASPKGTMSGNIKENTAVGNINYGYTTRGNNSYTDFLRYDYANDTGASTPKGSLSFMRLDFAGATGSQSYGYFMGGTSSPSTYHTSIDRIEYANDTATASPKGNLSLMIAGSNGWRRAGGFSGQSNAFGGTPTAPSTTKLVDKGADGYTNDYPSQGYGYWAGGNYSSRIDRLDYANDNAVSSPKGNLYDNSNVAGGASSLTHGYNFGGEAPSYTNYTSIVGRVDYSNDTATAAMKGPLSAGRRYVASVGNTNFGYTGSGTNPSIPNVRTIIDRLDYSNDSATALAKGSMVAMGNLYGYGAVGNQNFGYFVGGYNSGYRSEVQRVDYANDTNPTTWRSYLATAGTAYVGAAGNANFGYVGYGYQPSSGRTIIDRIDYSNDTTVTRKGNLSSPLYYRAATGNGSYGYWGGGQPGQWAPGYYTNQVFDRLDYANDTATTLVRGIGSLGPSATKKSAFSAAEGGTPTFAYIPRVRFIDLELEGTGATPEIPESVAGPAYGYFAGGQGAPSSYHIDRLDFSNDTAQGSPKGQLGYGSVRGGGTGNQTHGYVMGGSGGSRVQRVDYSNDTAQSSLRGPLNHGADYCSSVGNNDYGYTGGRPWSYPYYFGKVDYANDTAPETSLGGSSTFYPGPGYYGYGACGNLNYGYFVGGASSRVRRCDYSNDTAQLTLRGPLTANSNYCTATGSADYGYADNPGSSLSRIDYSNDTANPVQRGPLTTSGPYKAACGTGSYGYWAGGTSVSPHCTVTRLDYANDTATATPKGPLSVGMYRQAAFSARENGKPQTTSPYIPESLGLQAPFQPPFPFPVQAHNPSGNFSYGYFGGGANPAGPHPHPRTTIDRIEYANDTSTATPKGTLSAIRYNYSYRSNGVSSPEFGYFLGFDGGSSSKADRIDYSNDTAGLEFATFFPLGTGSASAGTANYGYIAGGVVHQTNITRINYSDETTTSVANLTESRTSMYGGAGNQSYGYFMGGYNPAPGPGYLTSVERLDYSSDTTTPTVKGPLNLGRQNFFGGVGNANYGYIGGGAPPFELSSVERIDFNNDTATASPKGPLSTTKQFISGTGTTSYGYVAGGEQNNPSYATFSTIDRIDFASDTATASPKGPLSEAKMGTGSVSATTNAKTP